MNKELIKELQRRVGVNPDGDYGPKTHAAVMAKLPSPVPSMGVIPSAWLQPAPMKRIIAHWTAGSYTVSGTDKEHYHFIVAGDGSIVKGDHDVSDNVNTGDGDYAAHTRGCNTGSIGISMACMAGAKESPFDAGRYPTTRAQWDTMIRAIAQLAAHYSIPVMSNTILSHAEVQDTLGIAQAGKWDIARLAFDPNIRGATAVGDRMRSEVKGAM